MKLCILVLFIISTIPPTYQIFHGCFDFEPLCYILVETWKLTWKALKCCFCGSKTSKRSLIPENNLFKLFHWSKRGNIDAILDKDSFGHLSNRIFQHNAMLTLIWDISNMTILQVIARKCQYPRH